MSAGLAMGRPGGRGDATTPLGTAVVGTALAVLTIVAALGIRASLDGLRQEPERVGAPWDVSIADPGFDQRAIEAEAVLLDRDLAAAAAGIAGTDVDMGGHVVWVHAFVPVDGVDALLPPPILSGRAPSSDDEIALGEITRRDLGVDVGDTVELISTSSEQRAILTVVGTAVVNDTYESCGGCGGIVTPGFIAGFAPEADVDPNVYELVPGTDVDAIVAELGEIYPSGALGPVVQQAVRNIERIRALPVLLATLASLMALASVAHALVLSLRRHLGELAVLRAVGFTRGQIRTTVITHGASLGVVAIVVGVPLGLVVARQGWRLLVDRIGVAFAPQVPMGALAIAIAAVLATIVVVALVAGQPAVRARPSATLRVE
ncbi:MAG: FtsX-like permease family protein [Acidimicrobiales bacterium]